MFSLPRQNTAIEATIQGRKSFHPGRNFPNVPFRQYSSDGNTKKEFLPHRSSRVYESTSNEIRLANWANLQHKLTAQNLDDMALDLMQIRNSILDEKDKVSLLETNMDLLNHLLSDSEEIKNVVSTTTVKIEKRLERIEELIVQMTNIKTKVPKVIPMAFALATQGYEKNSFKPQLERSFSFRMFSADTEDEKSDFDFGQNEADLEEVEDWIGFFKSCKPALEPKYLQMMSAHTIKTEVPDIPQSSALNDTSMPSASTAL